MIEEDFDTHYSLRIWVDEQNSHKIDEILGVKTNQRLPTWWELVYTLQDENEYLPFVDYFLDLLDGKYEQLKEIGVHRDAISVWYTYCYDSQCNMEFSSKEMYRLGKEGIGLCITCYNIHEYNAKYDEMGNIVNEGK